MLTFHDCAAHTNTYQANLAHEVCVVSMQVQKSNKTCGESRRSLVSSHIIEYGPPDFPYMEANGKIEICPDTLDQGVQRYSIITIKQRATLKERNA